jgi:hypothetical protein
MNSNIMPTQMAARRRTCASRILDDALGREGTALREQVHPGASDRLVLQLAIAPRYTWGYAARVPGGRPACVKMDRMACGNAIRMSMRADFPAAQRFALVRSAHG